MEQKKVNPIMKLILELGPIILFFVVYAKIKDQVFLIANQQYEGFIIATALFIPLILYIKSLIELALTIVADFTSYSGYNIWRTFLSKICQPTCLGWFITSRPNLA